MRWPWTRPARTNGLPEVAPLDSLPAEDRLRALVTVLDYALGPGSLADGEQPDRLHDRNLPPLLAQFYGLLGCREYPHPERSPVVLVGGPTSLFYTGIQHVHLADLDHARRRDDGSIELFWEQSGNWVATASCGGHDPEMWVQEALGPGHLGSPARSGEPLSAWLVAHCLAAVAWEPANSLLACTVPVERPGRADMEIHRWLGRARQGTAPLWSNHGPMVAELEGTFSLLQPGLLVHSSQSMLRVAALSERAADRLHRLAKNGACLE